MSDVTVGAQLVLDAGGAVKSMKDFKKEIREAQEDLLNIQNTFGETSKEAFAAAKKVAGLKDAIQDANETAKLFDPGNKFQTIGNAVRGLVGGFTALQGALALVGLEGDDVQKTLVKIQGALALTEGLNVVADVTKDFKRLGSVLVQTLGKSGLIGVAIAGVTALGLAFTGVFDSKKSADVKALNDSLKDYSKAAADARQKTIEVGVAFEQAKKGVISKEQALKVYNDTLGDSLGKTDNINEAEKRLADKAETYIKITALKAQANALFAKSAQITADALISQQTTLEDVKGLNIVGVDISKGVSNAIKQQLTDATKIEDIAKGLLTTAGNLSKQFGINTGGATASPKTAATKTGETDEQRKKREELEFEKRTRDEYNNIQFFAEQARIAREKELRDQEIEGKIDDNKYLNETLIADNKLAIQTNTDLLQAAATINQAISDQERAARVQNAQEIGSALGALATLIGEQTAAGKALAIAQAVINTWLGVTEVLRTKSVLPEPFATISRIANITTVVASGLSAIKNIGKAKVPGASAVGGTGSLGANTAAPIQPRTPGATNTLLNQDQLNQIGNSAVRAFVVETDITNSQERIRRLNRAARI